MNCPKCGYTINENDAFCKACGNNVRPYMQNTQSQQSVQSTMNSQPSQGYDYHSQFQQPNNNAQSYNINNAGKDYYVELIDAYIGKNADKIKSGKFSWPTLIFGNLYAWYRKMWILWLVWGAVSSVLSTVLSSFAWIVTTIGGFAIAANFNKMYMNNVKETVQKIVQQNPGKTKEELKAICAKKGGTTKGPIIFVAVFGVIFAILIGFAAVSIYEEIQEAKKSYGKSEAALIVSGVNNYCATAAMREQLTGEISPCNDGVDILEVYDMVELDGVSVIEITYQKGRVKYLKIETSDKSIPVISIPRENGKDLIINTKVDKKTIEYDGISYSIKN